MSSSYDPNLIIEAAQKEHDFSAGQIIFQTALLDWVDDARESTQDPERVQEAIATLWLAYANYLIEAKQFKTATETYEQAVECPIAGKVGRVWLEYARFAEDRGKLRTAQDVYIRALVGKDGATAAVTDEQDATLLWQEFLEMMRKSNPDLTMSELQSAVQSEQPAAKKIKLEPGAPAGAGSIDVPAVPTMAAPTTQPPTETSNRTHVILPEAIQAETKAVAEILAVHQPGSAISPDLIAAWMVRDGNGPAQPPEPPLFEPSPPKLSDPVSLI